MEQFILNDIDYTTHIVVPSYSVQSEPVVKQWEDATYTNHNDLLRWRMTGSFKIYFDTNEELDDFLDTLNNLRGVDNYIPATLYDLRTHSQKTSRYNIKISLSNDRPYFGNKKHDGYNVTIEEQ